MARPSSPEPILSPIDEEELEDFIQVLSRAPSDIRESMVVDVAKERMFTCEQLGRILQTLTFADER